MIEVTEAEVLLIRGLVAYGLEDLYEMNTDDDFSHGDVASCDQVFAGLQDKINTAITELGIVDDG